MFTDSAQPWWVRLLLLVMTLAVAGHLGIGIREAWRKWKR